MNPGTILEIILQNLMQLMPFRIVLSYQLAVRWTWGQNPESKPPGFHWCVWFMHSMETVTAAEEVMNLPTQSVVTADGVSVCYSVNIGVRVVDAVKHYCEVQDFRASVEGLAMTHLAKRVRTMNYSDAVSTLDKLEKSLVNTLESRLTRWGTEVTTVGFTDFVQVRSQIRLFQDPSRFNVG